MLQIPFFSLNMLGCNEWNGVSKNKELRAQDNMTFCIFFFHHEGVTGIIVFFKNGHRKEWIKIKMYSLHTMFHLKACTFATWYIIYMYHFFPAPE